MKENELCVVCGSEPTKIVPYTTLRVCDNLACHIVVVEGIICNPSPEEQEVIEQGDVCQK